jgi:quercetin dioxygenase-like cupin family protein
MSVIKFALLKIPAAISAIQKEVAALRPNDWQPHMNKRDYEGEWDVLSLRSPGGKNNPLAEPMNGEEYADTALMQQCPSIQQLIHYLQCEKLSVRLLNLQPGAVIKEHTDKELCFEKGEARLHFPVFTNPLVEFFIDGTKVKMLEGDCWYINANLPHSLANKGDRERIHLVIDCKVNEWLCTVFQKQAIQKAELSDAEITIRNKDTILNTISELKKQTGSVTAMQLAARLEHQLHEAEKNKLTDTIITFIRSIGIAVHEEAIEESTFLPGINIVDGGLIVDKNKLLYPGDLLHEAGHIAVASPAERPQLNEQLIKESKHREAEEMMTIAWSYAACTQLNMDPLIVFHEQGYKGGGSNIAENFKGGHYFGTPMLEWCGMTTAPKHGFTGKNVFPAMIKWIRE